jgi:CIC family chloride channel protein
MSLLLGTAALLLTCFFFRKLVQPLGIADIMINGYIDFHFISVKGIIVNTIGSLVSLIGGLHVGSVGPTVLWGAGLAGKLAKLLSLNPAKMRTLLACGAAGAISALFNAPLGGMIFAVEIFLRKYNVNYIVMIIVSSFTSSLVSRWLIGDQPVFQVANYVPDIVSELPFFIVLGLLCGLYAFFHIKLLYGFEAVWSKTKWPRYGPMFVSMLFAWMAVVYFPSTLFGGFQGIEDALHDRLTLLQLAMLLIVFIVGHVLVISAGFYGGIFGPVLFAGAALGGVFGQVMHLCFPGTIHHPGLYALIGIGGVIASTCRAPLTSIVLLFEMTDDYNMVLPLMITSVIAYAVHSGIEDRSVFTAKLFQNPVHKRNIPLI